MAVSSLTDTWLLLRNVERDGERNRLLFVIKSRGMAHSNQVREFVLTSQGAELLEVAVGPQGVLTGSARELQQARLKSAAATLEAEIERRRTSLERHAASVEAQIEALRQQLLAERAEFAEFITEEKRRAADQVDGQLGAGRQRGESP